MDVHVYNLFIVIDGKDLIACDANGMYMCTHITSVYLYVRLYLHAYVHMYIRTYVRTYV